MKPQLSQNLSLKTVARSQPEGIAVKFRCSASRPVVSWFGFRVWIHATAYQGML